MPQLIFPKIPATISMLFFEVIVVGVSTCSRSDLKLGLADSREVSMVLILGSSVDK